MGVRVTPGCREWEAQSAPFPAPAGGLGLGKAGGGHTKASMGVPLPLQSQPLVKLQTDGEWVHGSPCNGGTSPLVTGVAPTDMV